MVLLGAGDADIAKAQTLLKEAQDNVTSLVGQLSIDQSALVIKEAEELITGDTGMMHIASAFETPIKAIWGNTHPLFGMYAYRPDNSRITNHQVPLACNPCSKLGSDKCPRGHFQVYARTECRTNREELNSYRDNTINTFASHL